MVVKRGRQLPNVPVERESVCVSEASSVRLTYLEATLQNEDVSYDILMLKNDRLSER